MKKNLLGLVAIPLIAIGGLTYADDAFLQKEPVNEYIKYSYDTDDGKNIPVITVYGTGIDGKMYGVTIKAMNEGTTTAGTGNESYGYYFQWGNNHGNNGNSETIGNLLPTDDLANWANKGYNGTETRFIKKANNYGDYRSGLTNYIETGAIQHSLWGGSGDNETIDGVVKGYNTGTHQVTNLAGRQGPCESGYHVPSAGEWQELVKLYAKANGYNLKTLNGQNAWANTITGGTAFSNDLLLPRAGLRNSSDGAVYEQGVTSYYWSSSPGGSNLMFARNLYFSSNTVGPSFSSSRAIGQSLRCFKNSYIELPQTFNLYFMASTGDSIGDEIGSGTVTDNTTGATIAAQVSTNATKTGYVLEYRYLSGANPVAGFDFTGTAITGGMADASGNVYFIAQWTGIKYNVEFTGTDVSGTMANQEFTYGVTGALTANAFTKTGYTFSGWSDGTTGYTNGQEVSNLTTTGGAIVTLTAEWNPNTYTVKFDAGEGNGTMNDQEFTYDVAQNLTGNTFTRDGYTFSGWTDGITAYTDKQNVKNLTGTSGAVVNLTAQWKQNTPSGGSSSGGGSSGGGSRRATTTDDSKLPGTTVNNNENSKDNSSVDSQNNNTQGKTYSDEFKRAYEFAYKNGITTMDTIEKAEMDKPLTRIAMAKMLSYYAINILGKKPANIVVPNFSDVSDKMDEEYDNGVTLAYQLGIMGINMPNNKFRPNDLVTRAEFGTALSRMLFGIADGKDKYYSTHLAKLMEEKIITNDDPNLQELRGYVMIMLMRSTED